MTTRLLKAMKALEVAEAKRNALSEEMKKNTTAENVKAYEAAFDEWSKAYDEKTAAEAEDARGGDVPPLNEDKPKDLAEGVKWIGKLKEAVTAGTTFNGVIPTTVAADIVAAKAKYAKLRGYCNVITGIQGNFSFAVEGNGVTVTYRGEGAAYQESNPTVSPVTLTARNLSALVKVTREALNRPAVDALAYVENMIAKGFAEMEDKEILFGTGTADAHITGVDTALALPANSGRVLTIKAAEFTWANIKKFLSMLSVYKSNAIAVMSQSTADLIQEFKNGDSYIFPNQDQDLQKIKGVRVVISPAMSDITAGKTAIIAGDFSYYRMAEESNLEISLANELFRANGQVGVFADEYIDGNVALPEAFASLKISA